jgi:uncharacterized protein (DUF1499 family)
MRSLPPCPDRPNCVCSQAPGGDARHAIEPLHFTGEPAAAWAALREVLDGMARVTIIEDTGSYLHAEARSLLFRFVDDVECTLDSEARVIHVRSASRQGYGDMGVNRRRVETLRGLMRGKV